jgi:hypothetical protein
MQRPRKTFFISAGATAMLAAVVLLFSVLRHGETAHASTGPDLISALPAGAPAIVYIDFAAMRASSFYQHRPDKGPIAVPNQDYANFIAATGFDFEKDLDRVVLATWPPASPKEQPKMMAIGEGRFDRAKIRTYALREGKLEQQQGHDVIIIPTASGVPSSFTFLDDHRIALVSGSSLAPFFAAKASGNTSDPAAADPSRERAARLDGAAAFAIIHVPPIPPDKPGAAAAEGAATAQMKTLARSVQWVTLAARPEGDDLRISLEGECDTATNAQQIKAALELMRMFGSSMLSSPKTSQSMDQASLTQLQNLLSGAQVTQSAERVRILIELTPDFFKLALAPVRKPQ